MEADKCILIVDKNVAVYEQWILQVHQCPSGDNLVLFRLHHKDPYRLKVNIYV